MRKRQWLLALALALPASAWAGYQQDFEKEFMSKAWTGEQVEANACIDCHSADTMQQEFRSVVESWNASWHAQNGIACEHCHGGDPKDAAQSMSRKRGFLGTPKAADVPAFCGKCHVGILANFLESGHGHALRSGKKAPTCVTCHGSHGTQKANIDIINEQLCTRCHTYDRARDMKQALFMTEKKFAELERNLALLKQQGIYTEQQEKNLFNTEVEFRTLFHTVDVNLVKQRTDAFSSRLDQVAKQLEALRRELSSRRNFSAYLLFAFSGMGIVIFLLSKTPDE
jgi:predicted CXXCH cytochrome family protein